MYGDVVARRTSEAILSSTPFSCHNRTSTAHVRSVGDIDAQLIGLARRTCRLEILEAICKVSTRRYNCAHIADCPRYSFKFSLNLYLYTRKTWALHPISPFPHFQFTWQSTEHVHISEIITFCGLSNVYYRLDEITDCNFERRCDVVEPMLVVCCSIQLFTHNFCHKICTALFTVHCVKFRWRVAAGDVLLRRDSSGLCVLSLTVLRLL